MTEKYTNSSKQGYPVIYRGKKAVVLFCQTAHQPYLVVHGYSEEYGVGGQGSYHEDLKAAMAEADGAGRLDSNEHWAPDAELLHEAAEALVESTWMQGFYFKRYLVAATEWYAWRYLNNLHELIEPLLRDASIVWSVLDDRARTGALAGIAYNHVLADWDNIDEEGDFESRCCACIADDIATDPRKYINLLGD